MSFTFISEMLSLSFHPISGTVVVLAFGAILNFLVKLYKARWRMIELRKQGLPMPPYNIFFGHLLVVKAAMSKLPSDARGNYIPSRVRAVTSDLGPDFYLDLCPFGPQMLVVTSPHALFQMTQEHSLPKFHALREFLRPMTGEYDLVTMEGDMWKKWRSIFNPGFSPNRLMSFVSAILEETTTFCEILREKEARKAIIPLKKLADNLTMDVIGRVVLDARLNSQISKNKLVSALRRQIPWLSFGAEFNPLDRYNPLRPLIQWYNTRQMDSYIFRDLEDRLVDPKNIETSGKLGRSRSIIDLALKASLADTYSKNTADGTDAAFKSFLVSQIKLFIFAGYNSTSTTICYMFHLLSCNRSVLDRVRAEHDNVFSPDISQANSAITENPQLLNQLPLTVAIIKETLRLFPPSSSTRAGEPGFLITGSDGRKYPTDGFMVWSNHEKTHRDSCHWPRASSFLPERWLATAGDPLYPVKGAWRPFEHGPRNCISQNLAILELKIVMVMTLREFSINTAYEQWDELKKTTGSNTVEGERAYQVGIGEPSEGLPCTIKKAKR